MAEEVISKRSPLGERRIASIRGWSWPLLGLGLCTLVFSVLPGGQVRLGAQQLQGLVGRYSYEWDRGEDCYVNNLRLYRMDYPGIGIELAWDYQGFPASSVVYEVKRTVGGVDTILGETSDPHWSDPYGHTLGARVDYSVRVKSAESGPDLGLPSPPSGADSLEVYERTYASGEPWSTIYVIPQEVEATENQTADSRLDLRYGNPVYQDYRFGSRTYRGGLFAGYAADPSRVGRSYLKFELPAVASGDAMWPGTVHAYFTRAAADGTTLVGCQPVSAAWSAASLKWSTAPTLTPGDAAESVLLRYEADDPVWGVGRWVSWRMDGPLWSGLGGGYGTVAVGLASLNESASGWAYFSKKENDATKAPRYLYASGGPVEAQTLTFSPATVTAGGSVTGTVTLTGYAPAGGSVVTLSVLPGLVSLPASVTVPAGARTATFTVSTSPSAYTTWAAITADNGAGYPETTTLIVTP
jgi:hypothetical protein